MAIREFDLNIERVLENWTVAHALREVIANALDEQALTEPCSCTVPVTRNWTPRSSARGCGPEIRELQHGYTSMGLRVAEEDNFLFSYNITSPTRALRRALNRERSNVGRGAYTDRVKSILLACEQDEVIEALVADLQNYEHALSGAPDVSFAFEEQLTQELGRVVARRLTQAVEHNELTRQSTDSRGRSPMASLPPRLGCWR